MGSGICVDSMICMNRDVHIEACVVGSKVSMMGMIRGDSIVIIMGMDRGIYSGSIM